jgi:hypothetical protein
MGTTVPPLPWRCMIFRHVEKLTFDQRDVGDGG